MSKIVPFDSNAGELDAVKKVLSEKSHSYILITCSDPSQSGDFDVEMSCAGDPDLLACLMDSAKSRL